MIEIAPSPIQYDDRKDRQLAALRSLDMLQVALAGCADDCAVYSSAVSRVSAAFAAPHVCLALWDAVAQCFKIAHHKGRHDWDQTLFEHALRERRTIQDAAHLMMVAPIVRDEPGPDATPFCWGVLAVDRRPVVSDAIEQPVPFRSDDRKTLRGAATRIGVELERRLLHDLDYSVDVLLRKAKPIDVYAHALRELRCFTLFDHSASVMTLQRGMPQLAVRAEKVVEPRPGGEGETLLDSARRGRVVTLTQSQTRYLATLDHPVIVNCRDDQLWNAQSIETPTIPDGLGAVLRLDRRSTEKVLLCMPLIFGGQTLGILRLAANQQGAFDNLGILQRVLDRFAHVLSVTLYRSELYYQSDRQLRAVKEMGKALTQPMRVEEVCRQVLGLALRLLHAEAGSVGLCREDNRLDIVAHHGVTREQALNMTITDGITGLVARTGQSHAAPDVNQEPHYRIFNDRVRSEVAVPISYDREVIGVINVESFEENRFRPEDEEVVTFLEALAHQAAIAIKTAELRDEAVARLGASLALNPALTTAALYERIIDELRATNERLAQANQAKSEFLANMSHELRTPLNAIIGFSRALLTPEIAGTLSEEDHHQSLEDIRSSGQHLLGLINDILDLSKVEAGRTNLDTHRFALCDVLDNVRVIAETLAQEHHKHLCVTIDVETGIETIRADEGKFRQIMYNLLSNAVKFTPTGGTIAVIVRRAEGGLRIEVADTGIGIASGDQERIFEAFQQIDSSASRHYQGTGLGLALVRKLVELHGGSVWVESELGQGSCFVFTLPHALRDV